MKPSPTIPLNTCIEVAAPFLRKGLAVTVSIKICKIFFEGHVLKGKFLI